jgi:Protein of unknown function (DUF2905)
VTPEIGRIVVLVGIALVVIGGAAWLGIRIPGDIVIQGDRGIIVIPLGTMIVVSIVLSVVAGLLFR